MYAHSKQVAYAHARGIPILTYEPQYSYDSNP